MAPPFNVAVIGYGLSAKVFHIPLILALPSDFTLYGIVQRTPKPDNDAAANHPGIKTWTSDTAMLQDAAVDVVIVTSVPTAHYDQATAALKAGKHVVVEKPFCPTAAEADKLATLAKESGKLLTVYQNRRWDQDFLTLKEVLSSGKLGDVVEFETHYDRFRPEMPKPDAVTWKNQAVIAGGALYDLGSHLLDQVYHLFGKPNAVTGFVGVHKRGLKDGDCAPDFCTVLLDYGTPGEKMFVTVKSSSISPEEDQLRFWIRGTKGTFKKMKLDVQEDQLKTGGSLTDKGFGEEPESQFGTLTEAEGSGFKKSTYPSVKPTLYVEYYKIFAKALRGQGEVPVKPEDAADVLRIIDMAQKSSSEGQTIKW